MEYYIILVLVIALATVLFIKRGSKLENLQQKVIADVTHVLDENEAELVCGVYNQLPSVIKSKIDSKLFAEIVGNTIDIAKDVINGK